MLPILMQLGTHGSSITINLLVNVSHKLMSRNLMRLCGSTPKLDICHLKKTNLWKIAKASDLKEDWDKFRKIRNKLKSVLRKKYRCFVDNLGEMLKVILKDSGLFLELKRKVNHYLVKFKTILLALRTIKARRVCLTTILNLYLSK